MSGPASLEPLRVLQVNSLLTGGGTDDQCVRLAQGLVALGQQVWLAAPADRELSDFARSSGVSLLPTPPEGPLKLGFIRAVARYCRELRIQIVHGHHGRDLWPTILAARASRVRPRVVLTRHLAKSPSSWLSRRFLLSRCDALVAVSHFVARVLTEGVDEPESPVEERRRRPPLRGDHGKIRVVHGGIDAVRFQPTPSPAQRQEWGLGSTDLAFGVVGGYDRPRGKGQEEFLRAAAHIRDLAPMARFLVVGRGNLRDRLEAEIVRLGLAGRASLTPYCRDMPAAMNALDCLVHPQVATDAFPTVILEAMACNKPVIATACDGAPEQFIDGEHGLLVPMENVPALAEALRRMAVEPGLRSRLSRHGRRHVLEHFTLDRLARRILDLYRELWSGPRN